MSIDTETARRVAKLARIKVEDDALPALAGEFNTILGFIDQLGEVDVDGVEQSTAFLLVYGDYKFNSALNLTEKSGNF